MGSMFAKFTSSLVSWILAVGLVAAIVIYGPGILIFHAKIPRARASALSFVCASSAAATSTASCTGESTGNLLLIMCGETSGGAAPTLPTGVTSITSLTNSAGGSGTRTGMHVGWTTAASSSSGSGTCGSGTTDTVMMVYSGQAAAPIGPNLGTESGNNSNTSVSYNADTLSVTDGSSWFAGFAVRNVADSHLNGSPPTLFNRTSTPATPSATGLDTNGPTASNLSLGGVNAFSVSAKYTSVTLEIIAAPVVTVGATGTQVSTLAQGTTSADIGGAFAFIRDIGSANITSIKIHNSGTLDASTYLSNVFLIYNQQTTCSASPPLSGSSQYNLTAGTFNASNDATMAAAAGTPVGTSQICWYVEFDVSSSAPIGSTIDIQITDPATDVVANQGSVSPTSAVALSGSTTIVGNGPTTDQLLRGGEFFSGGSKSPFFWAN